MEAQATNARTATGSVREDMGGSYHQPLDRFFETPTMQAALSARPCSGHQRVGPCLLNGVGRYASLEDLHLGLRPGYRHGSENLEGAVRDVMPGDPVVVRILVDLAAEIGNRARP